MFSIIRPAVVSGSMASDTAHLTVVPCAPSPWVGGPDAGAGLWVVARIR